MLLMAFVPCSLPHLQRKGTIKSKMMCLKTKKSSYLNIMALIDFLMVNCLVLPSQEGSQKESEKGWVLPKGGHWGGAFKNGGTGA